MDIEKIIVKENEFPCHSCGACCMFVKDILEHPEQAPKEYQPYIKEFPFKPDERGWCEKLNEDFECSVYDTRPKLCRVREIWEEAFKSKSITWKEYREGTIGSCVSLMKSKLGMSAEQIRKVYEKYAFIS